MTDISHRLSSLSPEKLALLQQLLQQKKVDTSALIMPQPRGERAFPLSFAQERLWFIHQFDEQQSSTYNVLAAYRLEGPLDIDALSRSLNALVQRHEVLRTCFIVEEDQPQQKILPATQLEIPLIDLNHHPETAQMEQVTREIHIETEYRFALDKEMPLRARILRLHEHCHILLVNIHHIASDTWSGRIAARDIHAFYHACRSGNAPDLPALPVQYADYAIWQRQWLTGKRLEQLLTFWQENLADIPHLLELPTDYPRPAEPINQGAQQAFALSPDLSASLKQLSQEQGTTLFMTLLAAYQVLLYRYTGQQAFLVGSPVANRNRTEVADLVGFFANTLVFRASLDGQLPFLALLKQVRANCLQVYEHEELPLARLLETLQLERLPNQHPLFQVTFSLLDAQFSQLSLPDLTIKPIPVTTQTTKFDLTLSLFDNGSHISGYVEYNTGLFQADTIASLAAQWQTLLESIISHPGQQIAFLPLLSDKQYQQIVYDWNMPSRERPFPPTFVHDLLEREAARVGGGTAVVGLENGSGDVPTQCLTYAELNGRANQLAHYLRSLGVGAETRVGLCLARSPDMLLSIFGILKAGGAYVPLDPTYPQERLAYMIADSQMPVILTQQSLQTLLPKNSAQIVCLDTAWEQIAPYPDTAPNENITPGNLAYVIYTSGSTGQPKGVQVTHENLFYSTQARVSVYEHPAQRFLSLSSFAFDSSVVGIFWSLCYGGTLFLATEDQQRDPRQLGRLIAQHQITHLLCLPTLYDLILTESTPEQLASLQTAVVAGEACSPAIVHHHYEHFNSTPLYNEYGPTEAAVWSSVYACSLNEVEHLHTVLIGRAAPHAQLYILDDRLQPAPTGAPGELYVGGVGITRGYQHQPRMTAEKFIPNPFARPNDPDAQSAAGSRLYKTGDLARYLPDGQIQFLGRTDHQVKIRGFRIELDEIEIRLEQLPEVQRAVVAAYTYERDAQRLAAYLVFAPGRHVEAQTLRAFLQNQLPAYMIPTSFISLDKIPLLPNGKVDRNALPAPTANLLTTDGVTLPETPTEQIIADIWRDLLTLEQISIHDNFFELGGHSLLATQLASRIRRICQLDLPLKTFFEAPTIAALAQIIDQKQAFKSNRVEQRQRITDSIQPVPRTNEYPLSFAQQRLWFLDRLVGHHPVYNLPTTLRLCGQLNVPLLEQSLNEIINRHEILRTTFVLSLDNQAVQKVAPVLTIRLDVADLSALPDHEREATAQERLATEARRLFDLSVGPLLRGCLLRLAPEEYILLLTLHHIIADGWSVGILLDELFAIYQSLTIDRYPASLPPLAVQYADFAVWQRRYLQAERLETQLAYWHDKLVGLPELDLPRDYPRPVVPSGKGSQHIFRLSSTLTQQLNELSQQEQASLFMVLLAAFQTLLYRYTQQTDIAVSTPVANRNHMEIEHLIGAFVNTLVIRTDLRQQPTFSELLHRVKQTALEAYANQDVPFELLVEKLQPERDLGKNPLSQVVFALQNAPVPNISVPELTVSPFLLDTGTVRFDLECHMWVENGRLQGVFIYSTDLFTAETINRTAAHFQNLLSKIAAAPHTPISNFTFLTTTEQALFERWNQTRVPASSRSVSELVAMQAVARPGATAVVPAENRSPLTYEELNRRANQIAHYLQRQGIGPEKPVAVCLNRSPEMIITLLGILKAGGAYVPLDPQHPTERLAYVLDDLWQSYPDLILITETALIESHLPQNIYNTLLLDQQWGTLSTEKANDPDSRHLLGQIAYIIYTSGSTGKPKGTQLTHAGLLNLVTWHQHNFLVSPTDRMTHLSGLGFDAAVWEIWAALVSGASLYLSPEHLRLSPAQLRDWMVTQQITKSFVPTPLAANLMTLSWPEDAALEMLLTGGDRLRIYPPITLPFQVINNYGPTEYTVVTTSTIVPAVAEPSPEYAAPTIGRPIANTELYILDQQMMPVAVGVYGELYISGAGIARGYLRRPALTAERFLPNPFSHEPGSRLYRTGDKARYLPDGRLEFAGRLDHQVQIRGFRIEPGEIEATLIAHPDVHDSIILTMPNEQHMDTNLVACVVPNGAYRKTVESDESAFIQKIHTYLTTQLPAYMIPTIFTLQDELPLTPNGKVDRQVLAASIKDKLTTSRHTTYTPPNNQLEEKIAAIWQESLKIERVGRHDNFFDLGGHSLLLVQVQERLAQQLDQPISLQLLFKYTTVAALASYLGQQQEEQGQKQPIQHEVMARATARRTAVQQHHVERHRARVRRG